MAQKNQGNPQWPLKRAVSTFHRQTLEQLGMTQVTQHVWPTEIYPGFRLVNQYRKEHHQWYSTGEGRRSFQGRIVSDDNAGNVTLEYSFLRYMRFAEMGVGAGVRADDVERQRKADHRRRYTRWNRSLGMAYRPYLRMEFNHLETRLATYLRDWYGWEFIRTIEGFADDTIQVILN